MRLCIKLLLVVLTAAGPSVCCCSAAAVVQTALGPPRKAADLPKKGSARHCCPLHGVKAAKGTPGKDWGKSAANAPERSRQTPDDRSCPCQEWRVPAVSPGSEGDVRPHHGPRGGDSPIFLLAEFATPASGTLALLGVAAVRAPRLPFMSADERLRAHHALRC